MHRHALISAPYDARRLPMPVPVDPRSALGTNPSFCAQTAVFESAPRFFISAPSSTNKTDTICHRIPAKYMSFSAESQKSLSLYYFPRVARVQTNNATSAFRIRIRAPFVRRPARAFGRHKYISSLAQSPGAQGKNAYFSFLISPVLPDPPCSWPTRVLPPARAGWYVLCHCTFHQITGFRFNCAETTTQSNAISALPFLQCPKLE